MHIMISRFKPNINQIPSTEQSRLIWAKYGVYSRVYGEMAMYGKALVYTLSNTQASACSPAFRPCVEGLSRQEGARGGFIAWQFTSEFATCKLYCKMTSYIMAGLRGCSVVFNTANSRFSTGTITFLLICAANRRYHQEEWPSFPSLC